MLNNFKMILLIDNHDSFTYNLVQYFSLLDQELTIYTNDNINLELAKKLNPQYLVISPGPKSPNEAGVSLEFIGYFHDKIPILGVCLGHQCIAQYFGAKIVRAKQIMHGKTSLIKHNRERIFKNIPSPLRVMRYHSLAIEPKTMPSSLTTTASSEDDTIMAIEHINYPIYGIQFHPEAIDTEYGMELLDNFIQQKG